MAILVLGCWDKQAASSYYMQGRQRNEATCWKKVGKQAHQAEEKKSSRVAHSSLGVTRTLTGASLEALVRSTANPVPDPQKVSSEAGRSACLD